MIHGKSRVGLLAVVLVLMLVGVGVVWRDGPRTPAVIATPAVAAPPSVAIKPAVEMAASANEAPTTSSTLESAPESKPARRADRGAAKVARREAKDRELIVGRYGKLFDRLNLSADQREQLTRLLIDAREASADYAGAMAANGVDATEDSRAFAQSVREVRADLQSQIKELLGEAGYAQFTAGEESMKQAAVIDRAQKSLEGTGASLSLAQANQLQAVLQELGVHSVNDAVIIRAAGFLSERQVEALEAQQALRARGAGKERVQRAVRKNKS